MRCVACDSASGAAGAVGRVDEPGGRGFQVFFISDPLHDLIVFHVGREAIAAQNEDVAFLRRHLREVRLGAGPHAEGAGEDVAMRMLSSVRIRELVASQQAAGEQKIASKINKRADLKLASKIYFYALDLLAKSESVKSIILTGIASVLA